MIINSLFTQVFIAGLAVALLFIYVKPTLATIGETQKTVADYEKSYTEVTDINAQLASLVNKAGSMSEIDQTILSTYMPDTVDTVLVSRDILNISKMAEVDLKDITPSGEEENEVVVNPENHLQPVKHGFEVTIEGSYFNVKYFLSLLEQNNYPLEVHSLTVTGGERGLLGAQLKIITYSRI
jgi:hypothetical protein